MGVIDEHNELKENEVYVCVSENNSFKDSIVIEG